MKKFLNEILGLKNLTWRHWLLIFMAYFMLNVPILLKNSADTNLAVFQAEAFLNKKLNIEKYFWDASVFEGKNYVSFPPVPSLLMLPLVAVFGIHINSVLVSLLIACLSMMLLYRLLQRLMPDGAGRIWVFSAFFFGSGFWLAMATSDHINGFAHVVCTALLFFLLLELTGKQRPIWIGIFWALSFLTRQMTLFYGFLVLYYLFFDQENKRVAFKNLSIASFVFLALSFLYLTFNYYRFNNFFETGYQYLLYTSTIRERVDHYGIFSIHYFLFNFYHMFIKGHNLIFTGNDQLSIGGMDQYGTSLLAASPFVLFAIKANVKKGLKVALWTTISFILLGILLYHNNGWAQVNAQRFSLDFLPALMILVALSYKYVPSWLFKSFVGYAILLNFFSFLIHGLR
jgi:hypothetical protein